MPGEADVNGAIFYASKYGSTAQYAHWIGEATGLPVFDTKQASGDPADYEFLILASAVLYFKLRIASWVRRHLRAIDAKPVLLVTVSGAPPGERLDGWIDKSLPRDLGLNMMHFALPGREVPSQLTLYDWVVMRIGALLNRYPGARKEDLLGFDRVDMALIKPIVGQIEKLKLRYPTEL